MRCSKCGFFSFDHLSTCNKCGQDLTGVRQFLGFPDFEPAALDLLAIVPDPDEPVPKASESRASSESAPRRTPSSSTPAQHGSESAAVTIGAESIPDGDEILMTYELEAAGAEAPDLVGQDAKPDPDDLSVGNDQVDLTLTELAEAHGEEPLELGLSDEELELELSDEEMQRLILELEDGGKNVTTEADESLQLQSDEPKRGPETSGENS